MSLTKKEYLEKKYIEFSKDVTEILKTNIFPSLEELDIVDILLFFQYSFWNTDDYSDIVRNLISINHYEIDDEMFHKLYPIIESYINNLKEFLRTN